MDMIEGRVENNAMSAMGVVRDVDKDKRGRYQWPGE